MNDYSKFIIMNTVSVVATCIVIGVACKVTRSAYPLLGLVFTPKWTWRSGSDENKNKEES